MTGEAIGIEIQGPRQAAIARYPVRDPGEGEVLIESRVSVVSAGTEMLAYRGELPNDLALDDTIEHMDSSVRYPLRYGYCLVGDVSAGPPDMLGRRVFAFAPHESLVVTAAAAVVPVPDDISDEDAVFLAHAETLVNLLQDGRPVAGERVLVLGQGLVGLLVTSALAATPLTYLAAVDPLERRRSLALHAGAASAHAPSDMNTSFVRELLEDHRRYPGFDLVYELSGNPLAADQAVELCGYSGRVVLGSWYGTKRVSLNLGGRFHRSRITLQSSQVSTIDPALSGEFDKGRRFAVAWEMIRRVRPERYVSTRIALEDGAEAYSQLEDNPGEVLTVLLKHPNPARGGA